MKDLQALSQINPEFINVIQSLIHFQNLNHNYAPKRT